MPASRKKKNTSKKKSGNTSGGQSKTNRRGSLIKPRHKRWFAAKCTAGVALLHGAMLLTWWVAPTWDPPRGQLFELVWAWMHQPTFYPFVALLIGGPVLTVLAIRLKGPHRIWLVLSWIAFGLVAWFVFHDRLIVMVNVLRWKYGV